MSKKIKVLIIVLSCILSVILAIILIGKAYVFFLKEAYPIEYSNYVDKYSEKYDVDKETIYAVIRTESSFNKDAKSEAGALGLMQITPDTFNWLKMYTHDKYDSADYLYIPEVNIRYGTYFLSMLLKRYESKETAICAYNAGMGAVNKWLEDRQISSDGINLDRVPYAETSAYLQKVLDAEIMYKKLYFK